MSDENAELEPTGQARLERAEEAELAQRAGEKSAGVKRRWGRSGTGRRGRTRTKADSHVTEILSAHQPKPSFLRESLSNPLSNYYMILVATLLLSVLGVVMVLSSSSVYAAMTFNRPYYYVLRQALYLCLGLPLAWWLGSRSEKRLKSFAAPAMLLALVLVLMTLVIGTDNNKGNQNWLVFGGFSMQPSEVAKPAMILWAATVWSHKKKRLHQVKELLTPVLWGCAVLVGMVLVERDLGTAFLMLIIVFSLLYFVGTSWRVLGGITAVVVGVVGAFIVFSPNRMDRIFAFIGHESASSGANDQPLSAIYALASGGWFGRGLGASRQKWGFLYDGAHNDFIMAVIGEEMGFVGVAIVIVLFSVIGFAGYRVAMSAKTLFSAVTAAGVTTWILSQAVVNICMAMKLLPVIGIPLPFISYGGSALLSCLIGIGLLIAAARNHPEAQRQLTRSDHVKRRSISSIIDSRRAKRH